MSLPLHWDVVCLGAARISLDHAAKEPEMLASFTHCERLRVHLFVDRLDAASMKILRSYRVGALVKGTSVRANFYDQASPVRRRSVCSHGHRPVLCPNKSAYSRSPIVNIA